MRNVRRERFDVGQSTSHVSHLTSHISPLPAFTLLEVLVVIAIIALLVAALLPTIASSVANARALQCQSNVRVICQQLINYASCSRGKFPPNVKQPRSRA